MITEKQVRELKQLINAYVESQIRLSYSGRFIDKEIRKAKAHSAERKEALDAFIDSMRE